MYSKMHKANKLLLYSQEFAIKEQLSAKTGNRPRSHNDTEAVADSLAEAPLDGVQCRTSSPLDESSHFKKTGSVPDIFGVRYTSYFSYEVHSYNYVTKALYL